MINIELVILFSIPIDELIEAEKTFHNAVKSFWLEHNYLTGRWWFLVILSIVSIIVWLIFVDKKRIIDITIFGLFYGVSSTILDSIGSNMVLWVYPYRLSPYLYPQLYPYDFGIIIIPFMFVYQIWGKNLRKFFLFSGLLSAFIAFIGESFMSWLNIYQEISWKNYYSFPIYWLLAILCWAILKYFKKLEAK